jgi:hypothetical protein
LEPLEDELLDEELLSDDGCAPPQPVSKRPRLHKVSILRIIIEISSSG